MKNTSSGSEESFFRTKGFFVALYSCLGAVAVLALVITIANFGQPGFQAEDYEEEAAPVAADQVEPYQSNIDQEAWFRPRQSPTPAPEAPAVPAVTPAPRSVPPSTPSPEQMPVPPDEPPPPTVAPPEAEAEEPEPPAPQTQTTSFTPFDVQDELLWPVYGDIAMGFSMDALIYDPTLVQYRTNDNLRITADKGTQVQASAAGQVLAIGRNVLRGAYVKIDHGNGWIATYGQLADSKLVSVGEVVQAGQLIGTVGEPSIFGTMHGPHVNMRLTLDDVPVNPYELLAAR